MAFHSQSDTSSFKSFFASQPRVWYYKGTKLDDAVQNFFDFAIWSNATFVQSHLTLPPCLPYPQSREAFFSHFTTPNPP